MELDQYTFTTIMSLTQFTGAFGVLAYLLVDLKQTREQTASQIRPRRARSGELQTRLQPALD